MTISLDGFVADQNGNAGRLYPDLAALRHTAYMKDAIEQTGAVLMGRRTFEMADPDSYVGNYEFQVPIFVLTHHPLFTHAPSQRVSVFARSIHTTSMKIGTLRPLCQIDLDHAGVAHHSDLAIKGDAGRALQWIGVDGQTIEIRYLVPLSVRNCQTIDSRFSSGLRFFHGHINGLAVARPYPVSPCRPELPQVLPSS